MNNAHQYLSADHMKWNKWNSFNSPNWNPPPHIAARDETFVSDSIESVLWGKADVNKGNMKQIKRYKWLYVTKKYKG